jgi:WD40 repeat protein
MIALQGARERVDFLLFSPDGRTLVAPCPAGVQVWHGLTGGPPASVLNHRRVWSVRFFPDEAKLLLFGESGMVVRDLPTGQAVEVWVRWPGYLGFCDVSPDGRFLVASQFGWVRCWPRADPQSPFWSTDPAAPSFSGPPLFLGNGERFVVIEARPTPAGGRLVYVIRETETGGVLTEAPVYGRGWFNHPVQSPDRRLIADQVQSRVLVFRADDLGAEPMILGNDSRKEFTGLAFHPSGRFLAAASNDNTLKLYDTGTWTVAKAFNFDIGRLRSVAFSPDGMLAAVGGDKGNILLWDVDL